MYVEGAQISLYKTGKLMAIRFPLKSTSSNCQILNNYCSKSPDRKKCRIQLMEIVIFHKTKVTKKGGFSVSESGLSSPQQAISPTPLCCLLYS